MSLLRLEVDEILVNATASHGRPHTTLAAVESLAMPLVQEVVFMANFRCLRCQERVAEFITKMNGETQSLVISILEKKVTLIFTHPNSKHDNQ